jgi:hypothetical protein
VPRDEAGVGAMILLFIFFAVMGDWFCNPWNTAMGRV